MSQIILNPYIFFHGQAQEALDFYKNAFGGEMTVQKYSEVPAGAEMTDIAGKENWLMHGMLEGDVKIMVSDTDKASEKAAKISLSLGGEDEAKLREIFEKLSEGGNVIRSLEKQFWGDIYGQFIDKFGVEWMMNISIPKEQS